MHKEASCKRVLRVAELKEETVKKHLSPLLESHNPQIRLQSQPQQQIIDVLLQGHAATEEEGA